MAAWLVTVAETALFTKQAAVVWDEATRLAFIDFISAAPDTGDLIPETGGLQKVRWGRPGTGKRGGVRVIYYFHDWTMPLYLLLVYAKTRQEKLTVLEKQQARNAVAAIRASHRPKQDET